MKLLIVNIANSFNNSRKLWFSLSLFFISVSFAFITSPFIFVHFYQNAHILSPFACLYQGAHILSLLERLYQDAHSLSLFARFHQDVHILPFICASLLGSLTLYSSLPQYASLRAVQENLAIINRLFLSRRSTKQ